jgi:hypothetical protein
MNTNIPQCTDCFIRLEGQQNQEFQDFLDRLSSTSDPDQVIDDPYFRNMVESLHEELHYIYIRHCDGSNMLVGGWINDWILSDETKNKLEAWLEETIKDNYENCVTPKTNLRSHPDYRVLIWEYLRSTF